MGDEVIILARRYSRSSRQVQFLARSEGDEFIGAIAVDKGIDGWRTIVELWLDWVRQRCTSIIMSASAIEALEGNNGR